MDRRGTWAPTTPIVGRVAELAALGTLLAEQDTRLVSITGPAGVGKTRLALEIARVLPDGFGGRVTFVPLAELRDPNLVGSAIVSALGATDLGSADAVDAVAGLLADQPTLLVLDNFEQVVAAGPTIAALVNACAQVKILVTSRHPLGLSVERCFPLDPLALPDDTSSSGAVSLDADAVRFLVARLRAIDPGADWEQQVDALVGICRRLDGLPLALELVARRARVLSLPALCDALDLRLPLLAGGSADVPVRQRTMAAALAWSHELLTPTGAQVFRRIGVCVGGARLDSVAALTADLGLTEVELLDALDELVSHSLVARGGSDGRFRMLEVVREFALQALRDADELADAERLHGEHFAALAQQLSNQLAGTDQLSALDRMHADGPNFSAAIRRAIDRVDAEQALRLCTALRFLWYVRGPLVEGQAFFAAALALPGAEQRTRAVAYVEAAALARHSGHLDRAASLDGEALALTRQLGEPNLLASALLQHGFVDHLRGAFAPAREALEECVQLRIAAGDRLGEARALHHLGLVAYYGDGAVAAAWDLQVRCLEKFRDARNDRHVATALMAMSELARARGELALSRRLLADAVGLVERLNDLPLLVYALYGAAWLAADEGRPSHACRVLGAAEGVQRICGAPAWPAVAAGVQRWLPAVTAKLGNPRVEALRTGGAVLTPAEAAVLATSADTSGGVLSAREREIAVLVAAGHSNRAIAQQLIISPRTVDGHVANIMAKLGFNARAQIAAWVAATPAE